MGTKSQECVAVTGLKTAFFDKIANNPKKNQNLFVISGKFS
jgi:hypothetical protein